MAIRGPGSGTALGSGPKFRGSASSVRGPARLTPGRERELNRRRAEPRAAEIEPTSNAPSEES